jgi:subtilase family serine protease
LSTRALTLDSIVQAQRMSAMGVPATEEDGSLSPQVAGYTVVSYTPAQIRAAYGLPALPAIGTAPTPAQAAQQGAGQTIYIVDAMHDPNVAAELAAFNQNFGLPTCTTRAAGSVLPLPAASTAEGCVLSVVYTTAAGAITAAAPAYNAGWAMEIALDVQWAHATAPRARIVLIEAPDASINSLLGAIKLANAMGPGSVSMSFGTTEGTWTAGVDAAFTGSAMSYLAATGDWGVQVSWPAVSPRVLAVGGTRLSYSGTGTRSEVAWSSTGGGISQYTPVPAYQSTAVPGVGTLPHRAVADVAFNADPASGQMIATMQPGSAAVTWLSVGGTSLSTPQWAGFVAMANALRQQASKPALGAPHAAIYGQIAAVPGTYASTFADVTSGADGTCSTCAAKVGYDTVTGLGTPNVSSLLSALSGASVASVAPVVASGAVGGMVGTALSFNVSVTAANAVSLALGAAPTGMTISNAGAVSWPAPVAGTYAVTVTARDATTGLSGQGTYTVKIDPRPVAPVVNATTVNGKTGTALAFNVAVTASNPVTFSQSGAPTGMTVSAAGAVNWANPVVGTFAVTFIATDTRTGVTGRGVYTVVVVKAQAGPVVTWSALSGVVGKALSGSISISDPGVTSLAVSITGAQPGMSFAASGSSILIGWAKPVLGTTTLTVSVRDSLGRTTQASVPITITAK